VKPLCGVLADSDWQVREEAATALGEIADPYAIDPIYKLLRNGPYHSSVSRAWIKALGSIGGPRVFGILCEALNNPNIDDSSYGAPRKGSMVDQELAWLSFHALCDLPMQQPEGVVRWMVAYVNRRKEPAMLAKLLDQLENRLTNSPSSFSKSALDTILRQEDSLKYQVNGWTSDFEKVTVENEVRRNVKLKELASLELSRRAAGRLQERPRQELSPHSGSQEQILGIPVDAPRFGYVPKTRKWWRFWG